MRLPVFQSSSPDLVLMQTKWASILNPVLTLPTNQPSLLSNLSLVSGNNVISHKLGTTPIGWIITDSNAAITVYRSAAFNPLTLTLNSTGTATISLMVF